MADETKLTAATRLEKLLDNIAGGDNEVTPATRLEKFLSYIADAMEGGGGSGGGGDSGGDGVLCVELTADAGGNFYTLDKTGAEIKTAFESGVPVYIHAADNGYIPYDLNFPSVDDGIFQGVFLSSMEFIEELGYLFIAYGTYVDQANAIIGSTTFHTGDLTDFPIAGQGTT